VSINGRTASYQVEARRLLERFPSDEVGLTGTHVDASTGFAGLPDHVDGRATRSCLMFAVQVNGAHIETIEACRNPEDRTTAGLFSEMHGLPMRICTPGMLIVAYSSCGIVVRRHRRTYARACRRRLCR